MSREASTSAVESRLLRIHGKVQGVGFRWNLCNEARRLGASGWVRNRRDGSVEALIQGEPATLSSLMAWCRHGPAAARVDQLEVEWAEAIGPSLFFQAYTL